MLTGRNPGQKSCGNFQKGLLLTLFFSYWSAWYSFPHYGYCISNLCGKGSWLNSLVSFVSLKVVICYIYYNSTGMCEKLRHICIFFIISFIIIVYVFVFQNIIIEERNFYVFTIFKDSQLVFVPLKNTNIFRVLCPECFDPYCPLTNYSWATILSWLSLPNYGMSYLIMELKILICQGKSFSLQRVNYCNDIISLWMPIFHTRAGICF